MKMQETTKSLRYYFILIGALSLLNIGNVFYIQKNIILGVFSLISVVFGLLYFYFGIKLNDFLIKSPWLIINFIIAGIIISLASQLYSMTITGYKAWFLVSMVVSVAIGLYLILNVKKLAKESQNIKQ